MKTENDIDLRTAPKQELQAKINRELKYTGSIKHQKGRTLFEVNLNTGAIKEAVRLAVQAFQLLGRAAESLAGAINSEREQKPKEGLAVAPVKKPRGVKKIWTPERVELLKSMSVGDAATYFGVTEGRIHNLRHQYGIARKYAKGQRADTSVRVKQRRTNPSLKSQLEGIVREEQQNRHEEAKRVAAEHGARATEGKVSVRVDPRTTVLMSPERAAAFNKLQHDNRNHHE